MSVGCIRLSPAGGSNGARSAAERARWSASARVGPTETAAAARAPVPAGWPATTAAVPAPARSHQFGSRSDRTGLRFRLAVLPSDEENCRSGTLLFLFFSNFLFELGRRRN
ncbi:hypothetical protein KFK09_027077 [Dendrobium nobile]|uniref:Uncharacterized protein n=1 Tax=Dendrobium nobile TaxID=94219 RepID=A0A8T3AA15_DENNO|nr:hypothetical protein KFK09_027077 [Dendrobium nobile]